MTVQDLPLPGSRDPRLACLLSSSPFYTPREQFFAWLKRCPTYYSPQIHDTLDSCPKSSRNPTALPSHLAALLALTSTSQVKGEHCRELSYSNKPWTGLLPGSSRGLDKHCSLLFYVHFYKVPKPACLPEVFLGILAPDHLNPSPPTSPRRQPDSC